MAGSIIGSIIGAAIPGLGQAIPSITEIARVLTERLVPDPKARAEAQVAIENALTQREAAVMAAVQAQNEQQSAINLAAAQTGNWFDRSWRPATAWICVFGFFYSFVLAPVMGWAMAIIGIAFGLAIPVPPTLDNGTLMTLLFAMLGLGTLRSVDKNNGVADPSPAAHNPAIPRR